MTKGKRFSYLFSFAVISLAVAGYFVGLQSPMNPRLKLGRDRVNLAPAANPEGVANGSRQHNADAATVLATSYKDIGSITRRLAEQRATNLTNLQTMADINSEFTITEQQKMYALAVRDKNRAFNGAPPTVPHPIDQMSAESCMACHGQGVQLESMRISKMSHQFLTNCTQCHVASTWGEKEPKPFQENSFVGLPAPTGGPRAFPGAPPQIPHSTWMRVDCMSCHGPSGAFGIRTTHPWRQSCQQCHTPSSKLDQTLLDANPSFISMPPILEAEPTGDENEEGQK